MQDEGTPELIAARLANVGHGGDRSKGSIEPLTTQEKAAKLLNVSRRIGAMLREMEMHPGGDPTPSHDVTGCPPTLADLGINRMASHRWQVTAAP